MAFAAHATCRGIRHRRLQTAATVSNAVLVERRHALVLVQRGDGSRTAVGVSVAVDCEVASVSQQLDGLARTPTRHRTASVARREAAVVPVAAAAAGVKCWP